MLLSAEFIDCSNESNVSNLIGVSFECIPTFKKNWILLREWTVFSTENCNLNECLGKTADFLSHIHCWCWLVFSVHCSSRYCHRKQRFVDNNAINWMKRYYKMVYCHCGAATSTSDSHCLPFAFTVSDKNQMHFSPHSIFCSPSLPITRQIISWSVHLMTMQFPMWWHFFFSHSTKTQTVCKCSMKIE